jgi:hypothetical protein
VLAQDFWWSTVPGMDSSVQLAVRNFPNQTAFTNYLLPRGKRRPLTQHEREFRGTSLQVGEQIMEVWQESITGSQPAGCPLPKVSDIWTDAAGVQWVIVAMGGVDKGLLDQRFNTHVVRKV